MIDIFLLVLEECLGIKVFVDSFLDGFGMVVTDISAILGNHNCHVVAGSPGCYFWSTTLVRYISCYVVYT